MVFLMGKNYHWKSFKPARYRPTRSLRPCRLSQIPQFQLRAYFSVPLVFIYGKHGAKRLFIGDQRQFVSKVETYGTYGLPPILYYL